MLFTPDELAEMAKADEEIERDFCITSEERRISNRLDADARLDAIIRQCLYVFAAAQKAYEDANREKIAAAKRAYRKANREKCNAHRRVYLARKRAVKNKNPAASEDTAGYLNAG